MTSKNPIAAYQDAIKSYETATAEAMGKVEIAVEGANKLRGDSWRSVTFSNTPVTMPAELRGGRSIDVKRWPTGTELAETLSAWHAARHAAHNAYRAIPQESRDVVKPPPD